MQYSVYSTYQIMRDSCDVRAIRKQEKSALIPHTSQYGQRSRLLQSEWHVFGVTNISLAGAATSIIFVVTKLILVAAFYHWRELPQVSFLLRQNMSFVATKVILA